MVRTIQQCGCCSSSGPPLRCHPCNDDLPSTFTFSIVFETTNIAGPISNAALCPGTQSGGWDEPDRSNMCDAMTGTYSLSRVPGVWRCYEESFTKVDYIFWRGGIVNIEYPENQSVVKVASCVDGSIKEANHINELEWIFNISSSNRSDPPRCSYELALVPKYIVDNHFNVNGNPAFPIPHLLCQGVIDYPHCVGYDNFFPYHFCIGGLEGGFFLNRFIYSSSSDSLMNPGDNCKAIYLAHSPRYDRIQHRRGPACHAPLTYFNDTFYYNVIMRGN